MQDILPIRPYQLVQELTLRESALDYLDGTIELMGVESRGAGIVIAGLVIDVQGVCIDQTGPEPRFLVAVAPPKEPRSFVLMTEREIKETFQPCELPDEPSQSTTNN